MKTIFEIIMISIGIVSIIGSIYTLINYFYFKNKTKIYYDDEQEFYKEYFTLNINQLIANSLIKEFLEGK